MDIATQTKELQILQNRIQQIELEIIQAASTPQKYMSHLKQGRAIIVLASKLMEEASNLYELAAK